MKKTRFVGTNNFIKICNFKKDENLINKKYAFSSIILCNLKFNLQKKTQYMWDFSVLVLVGFKNIKFRRFE